MSKTVVDQLGPGVSAQPIHPGQYGDEHDQYGGLDDPGDD
jgi:hypothetical protein